MSHSSTIDGGKSMSLVCETQDRLEKKTEHQLKEEEEEIGEEADSLYII